MRELDPWRARSDPDPTGRRTTAAPPRRGVLVVDDEPAVRKVVAVLLRHHGFEVWTAADGVEAETVYEAHRADIAAVVLDVQMPGRDGPATLAALRAVTPDLPCCFMSGNTGAHTETALRGLGAELLRKPFAVAELRDTLTSLLPVGR